MSGRECVVLCTGLCDRVLISLLLNWGTSTDVYALSLDDDLPMLCRNFFFNDTSTTEM